MTSLLHSLREALVPSTRLTVDGLTPDFEATSLIVATV
jgi:hypothetical protein